MKTTRLFVLFLLVMSISFPVGGAAFGQIPPAPAAVDDGSIKGFFLANNGGIDFSIDPDNPSGDAEDDDGERPNYALLASMISASKPSATDQIRAAETNTDIDVRIIRDAAKESIGDLIFFRTYLAFGDIEAARFHSEKIERQMLDAQLEVGFIIPPEQITLVESESPTDEEDLSNSGQRFVGLEEREQEAIEEGRLPPNPTFTTLNASDIYDLAHSVRGNIGGIAAANMFGDSEEVTFYANQMADSLLKIYYSTNNFAVPLEQVQVIGSSAPTIEELKQAVIQFGDISE
ncbi:MAG TPA: hypothetical protein VFZ67_03755 [Nitrososphaera sp.]